MSNLKEKVMSIWARYRENISKRVFFRETIKKNQYNYKNKNLTKFEILKWKINARISRFNSCFLTTVAFVPQAYKVYKTNQTKDLSLFLFLIFSLGVFLCVYLWNYERRSSNYDSKFNYIIFYHCIFYIRKFLLIIQKKSI